MKKALASIIVFSLLLSLVVIPCYCAHAESFSPDLLSAFNGFTIDSNTGEWDYNSLKISANPLDIQMFMWGNRSGFTSYGIIVILNWTVSNNYGDMIACDVIFDNETYSVHDMMKWNEGQYGFMITSQARDLLQSLAENNKMTIDVHTSKGYTLNWEITEDLYLQALADYVKNLQAIDIFQYDASDSEKTKAMGERFSIQKINSEEEGADDVPAFPLANDYDSFNFELSEAWAERGPFTVTSNDESIAKVGYVYTPNDKKSLTIAGQPISPGTTEFVIKDNTGEIAGTVPVVVPENFNQGISGSSETDKESENKCLAELSTYFKNPNSVQLVRSYSVLSKNPNYIMYLMDISAENSLGGTGTDSYFIVYDTASNKISAIAFDGVVSHANDIADQNKMYAKYLTLKDGVGSYITNQLQIKITDFADYLKTFYDSFFKK